MAKLTFTELTNRVLRRISKADIANAAAATGKALIITNLLNEAQTLIHGKANWRPLYKTRWFSTIKYGPVSTVAFNNATPATITDSANGFGNFSAGMQIVVSGSTNNSKLFTIGTAAAGSLALDSGDSLTTEAVGTAITIRAATYPLASDWGRTVSLQDITAGKMMEEDMSRGMDKADADENSSGTPHLFCLEGSYYRFAPIPAAAYRIREKYIKTPTALAATGDTSDLPIEVENCLIHYALAGILRYLKQPSAAKDEVELFKYHLEQAMIDNERKLSKMNAERTIK